MMTKDSPLWIDPNMIKNFSDHAANERTFLAWVRTAVALIGFGVVMERFDVFIRYTLTEAQDSTISSLYITAEIVGLGMILLGVILLGLSTLKYHQQKRQIAEAEAGEPRSSIVEYVLSVALATLALLMCFYLARVLF